MKTDVSEEVLKGWGVYKITNLVNGHFYIGSTTEYFKKRVFYAHLSDYFLWKNDKTRRSMCPILYNAFEKYGLESFQLEILVSFKRKKDSKTNKKIATFLEERFLKKLNPEYNICKEPSKGGCPNLGKKLSQEWKDKIGEKSKLYKHSDNKIIYDKKSQQNKDLSSRYRISIDDKVFEGSVIECVKLLNIDPATFFNWFKGKVKSKCRIEKLKSQKKSIKITKNKESFIFKSFGECDKYLKMWRGYTSTCIVNNRNVILDYKYELL